MKAILDTSVLIADDLSPLEGELAISAASLAELSFGVLVAQHLEVRTERLRRLSILQASFSPLPVDATVATSYGALASAVVAVGRQPPQPGLGPAHRRYGARPLGQAPHPQLPGPAWVGRPGRDRVRLTTNGA